MRSHGKLGDADLDLRLVVSEVETGRQKLRAAAVLLDRHRQEDAIAEAVGKLELARRALSAAIRRLGVLPAPPPDTELTSPAVARPATWMDGEASAHDALASRLAGMRRRKRVIRRARKEQG